MAILDAAEPGESTRLGWGGLISSARRPLTSAYGAKESVEETDKVLGPEEDCLVQVRGKGSSSILEEKMKRQRVGDLYLTSPKLPVLLASDPRPSAPPLLYFLSCLSSHLIGSLCLTFLCLVHPVQAPPSSLPSIPLP